MINLQFGTSNFLHKEKSNYFFTNNIYLVNRKRLAQTKVEYKFLTLPEKKPSQAFYSSNFKKPTF